MDENALHHIKAVTLKAAWHFKLFDLLGSRRSHFTAVEETPLFSGDKMPYEVQEYTALQEMKIATS